MSTTSLLDLPYLAAGQAQKHVTLNESLRMLDALIQLNVKSRLLAAPPASPLEGDRYLVAASPGGAWLGQAGSVAAWQDGGWAFFTPREGWLMAVEDEQKLLQLRSSAWVVIGEKPETLPKLGINATADSDNKLAVSSAMSLFNHIGAGHQIKINKASAADLSSLLFQTGYSGRIEIISTGDERLAVKISTDGQNWITALGISPNGFVGIGIPNPTTALDVQTANAVARVMTTDPGSTSGSALVLTTRRVPQGSDERLGYVLVGTRENDSTNRSAAAISFHSEGTWASGASHPTYIRFDTTDFNAGSRNERLRITANGRVGIGTSSPTAKLHVAGELRLGNYAMSSLPSASGTGAGSLIFISNESGGAVLAFSDGTSWRRVTDRAVVS